MQSNSYYSLLGLSPDATTNQIEAACKQMFRLYQSSGASPQRMAELNDAQAVLTDSTRRAAYNASLKPEALRTAGRGRGAQEADPGKALRWLGLLAALILPIGGIAWWVNRPAPARTPVVAPVPATASAEQESASPPAEKGVNYGHWQTKYSERTTQYNRMLTVESELGARAFRAKDRRPLEGQEAETEAHEIELLKREREWLDARVTEIDHVELTEASKGNLLPKLVYPGERVK